MASMADSRMLYGMLRLMALESWVSPSQLAPDNGPPERLAEVFRLLREFCTVGTGEHAGQWRLNDVARRRVFDGWKRPDLVEALRTAADNTVTAALRRALGLAGGAGTSEPSAGQLVDLRAALNWLPDYLCHYGTPAHDELSQQIERTALREEVDQLGGAQFVGRALQRRRLNALLADAAGGGRDRIVNIWGPGGIGKSSLLAVFQRHVAESGASIVLRLDFDQPALDPLAPSSLDREAIRQIGRAVPALWAECNRTLRGVLEFAAETARAVMQRRPDGAFGSSGAEAVLTESDMEGADSAQRSELMRIADRVRTETAGVVVLIDTFERVEAAGPLATHKVLMWLSELLAMLSIPALAVVAGRCKLAPTSAALSSQIVDMPLNQLSRKDARAMLTRAGCPADLALELVKQLPVRSPLILRLAADAMTARPTEGWDLVEKLEKGEIAQGLLSAYLYTRILAHIPEPVMRQYALASLALPELDVHVLSKVLMPEVEPDAVSVELPSMRFAALASVHWLIERKGERLRLRTDQRELVLKVVAADSDARELQQRVRSRALAYHENLSGAWHAAMALYLQVHRAMEAGEPNSALARFAEPLRKYGGDLYAFADDFPPNLRLALIERHGGEVDLAEAATILDTEEWRRMMDGASGKPGRGQNIVSRGDPLTAHRLYTGRPTALGALPPAYALQAACDSARWGELQFDWERACDELLAGFADSERWGPHLLHLAALIRFSLFADPSTPPALVRLLDEIVPACAAYGPAGTVADTFSLAEAFHGRRYLADKLLQKLRPSPRSDRVFLLHACELGDELLGRLTGAAVVRFDQFSSAACVVMDGSSTAAIEKIHELEGARWSAFQRFYRDLGKSGVHAAGVRQVRFHLPEFYRPLRQAMLEAFDGKADALSRFRHDIDQLVPNWPAELQLELFLRLAGRDPHTWLHALIQYADWCGVLSDLTYCAYAATGGPQRLLDVDVTLHHWVSVVRMPLGPVPVSYSIG